MDYLYRFRSLKSIFEYKELENLCIYFAKPEELNDQMEDYMNIVWQGDEIAFRNLFKHYTYALFHWVNDMYYYMDKSEHINTNQVPVYIKEYIERSADYNGIYSELYHTPFLYEFMSNIPKLMSDSNKKYTIDEILYIFKYLHSFIFYTVEIIIRKNNDNVNLLDNINYKNMYESLKYNISKNSFLLNLINGIYTKNELNEEIIKVEAAIKLSQKMLKDEFKDNDNFNINAVTYEFPDLYFKQIKRLLYNNHCVTCFSKTYQNEPMWAHYANNENGICLRFKIQNKNNRSYLNINSICNTLDENRQIIYKKIYYPHELIKVNYSNIYPEIDFFTSLGGLNEIVIKDFWMSNYDKTRHSKCLEKYSDINEWRKQYQEKANEYICTKSKNWSYEEEYRTFLNRLPYPEYENKDNRMANYNFEDLEAIIFGRKVSMENKRKIKEMIDVHCKNTNRSDFKFYDLYYSAIANELKLKPAIIY